jgi:hypothetical protein
MLNRINLNISFVVLLLLSICLFSCKPDATIISSSDAADQTNSEAYFEDYEAPFYKWGFIDTSGTLKIQDQFDAVRPFHQGIAIANKGGKWGYINKENEVIIPFRFRSAFPFSSGIARVQDFDLKYGYINEKGNFLIETKLTEAYDVRDGMLRYSDKGFIGYMNTNFDTIIPASFEQGTDFEKGFAIIKSGSTYNVIDKSGSKLFNKGYSKISTSENGIFRLKEASKFAFANSEGNFLSDFEFDQATDFQGNFSAVRKGEAWYLVDRNLSLEEIGSAQKIRPVGASRWAIKKDGKYGLLTEDGSLLTELTYDGFYTFQEDRIAFKKENIFGFLDVDGAVIIPPTCNIIWDFKEGFARCIKFGDQGGLFYIRKDGSVAFNSPSIEARDFSEGLAPVQVFN